jgi:prepilin-type N-terminal cleavage/methylation domain-containing protein
MQRSIAHRCRTRKRAMTLVELLIVVAIILLLLVTVIPNLAPTADQKCREAALTVTSAITRAQSRAAQNTGRGAGLWLQPLEDAAMVAGDTTRGSADLFVCEPQDSYTGDDPALARAFIQQTSGTAVRAVVFSLRACPFISEICAKSSLIQFAGNPATYFFRLMGTAERAALTDDYFPAPYQASASRRNEISLALITSRDTTTSLPAATPSNYSPPPPAEENLPGEGDQAGVDFQISRPMTRSASPPLSLPTGYVVDTAWSCVGTTLLTNTLSRRNGTPVNVRCIDNFLSNYPVHIMFNESNGAIEQLRYKLQVAGFGIVDEERTVTSDIYLLIGRADRAGNPYVSNPADDTIGANWQYPDSRWIRISRSTGETLIADPVLKVSDVFQSQRYARSGLDATRK